MRQKLFFLIIALSTFLYAEAYDFQSGDLYYKITSDTEPYTVEVTYLNLSSDNYSGKTTITIPETVTYGKQTYSVTSIGEYAFRGCSGLTSVTIPNSVISIGEGAFYNCSGLTSLTIPNSVISIGDGAFYNCSGLTSLTIPNSVTSIGGYAFYNCSGLTSLTIPNSVTSIGKNAFELCRGLTSVTIPNSVTSIGDFAFRGCSGLTSVTIPNSVTSIGDFAFRECTGLTSVTIPNSVTSIGVWVFGGCSGLTSVTIPNSVTSIGDYAFDRCSGLTSVTIPNSVTSIGALAFAYCSGLTSLTIPNSVTSIGGYAFDYCSGLTSLTIPNSVTSIGDYAFDRCSGLKSVMVNWEEPLSISSNVFGRLTLSGISLYVPNSVKAKYEAADVWKEFNIVGVADFEVGGLYYNITSDTEPYTVEVTSDDYSGMTIATIPETVTYNEHAYSVTSIGSSAFEDCSGLTSVTIPNSVISIGGYAFNGCSGLESVNIPNSVTSIGDGAFAYCSGLTSIDVDSDNSNFTSVDGVLFNKDKTILICCPAGKTGSYTIPNSVTSIGKYAFDRCSGLKSVMVNWEEPLSISSDVFGGLTLSDISLYVPNSVKEKYEAAEVWRDFNIIGVADFEVDGLYYNITSDTEPYTVEVTYQYYLSSDNYSGKTTITIPETVTYGEQTYSVTSIGEYAFYECSGLTSVTIPNSVTSIGKKAFRDCSSLTSVNIPNSVTSIGETAFRGCNGLKSVTIPNSVTSIGDDVFNGCSGLTSVTIPNSVTSIGNVAFAYCSGLKSVKVSWEEPLSISSSVFDGLTLSKTTLYVPNSAIAKYKAADVWKKFNIIDNDEPTAIKAVEAENNKTIKTIKDGQIVIIRNGVMYDMNGRKK